MPVIPMPAKSTAMDPSHFRKAMASFATGVAVVTTVWDGKYHGMTVSSLTSVSLDPCMLLICPDHASLTGLAIRKRGQFAVNVLGDHQRELSTRFVGDHSERFRDVGLAIGESGVPLLKGALAHFCCQVSAIHPGGDHDIVVGEVVSCSATAGEPLVLFRGEFRNPAAASTADQWRSCWPV
jgi:3-hydroxy-9,10-secoandrosta-1,3,5(10)-triene-9,17-dione monooxygenase reductase component